MHLHIVDPHERFTHTLSDIARRLLNLVVTAERAPVDPAKNLANARSYDACARFIQLPALLTQERKPMPG